MTIEELQNFYNEVITYAEDLGIQTDTVPPSGETYVQWLLGEIEDYGWSLGFDDAENTRPKSKE